MSATVDAYGKKKSLFASASSLVFPQQNGGTKKESNASRPRMQHPQDVGQTNLDPNGDDDCTSMPVQHDEVGNMQLPILSDGQDNPQPKIKIITVLASDGKSGESVEFSYVNHKVVGNGSFGVVTHVKVIENENGPPFANIAASSTENMLSKDSPTKAKSFGEISVAIKKVLQDKRFKNRELQIMRLVSHPNIVDLRAFFYSSGEKKDEVFLNLVLEFMPETLYRTSRHYTKMNQVMPMVIIKLFIYQVLRSLAYIHSLGICHRDIKPQNLLVDPVSGIVKLCDFGSAKILVSGEPNISYICSRYYRAPELIFGSTNYGVSIDIWSTGCVLSELLLGSPIFPGESSVDQLVKIIKVLGTPTNEQVKSMNENYATYNFPIIKASPWAKVFRNRPTTPDFCSLLSKLIEYIPQMRITAMDALSMPFFDELRLEETRMPNGQPLPDLFNFSPLELSIRPQLNKKLIPDHAVEALRLRGIDLAQFQPSNDEKA